MVDLTARYKVSGPHVVHDTIDNETILVNLKNGKYYSFEKCGVMIWDLITQSIPISTMIDTVSQFFEVDRNEIEAGLIKFVDRLIEEYLIGKVDLESVPDSDQTELSLDDFKINPRYEAPILHVYADMQDMLLLDPIHDTDEQGWPSGKDDE